MENKSIFVIAVILVIAVGGGILLLQKKPAQSNILGDTFNQPNLSNSFKTTENISNIENPNVFDNVKTNPFK